jgi:hypothetical protein
VSKLYRHLLDHFDIIFDIILTILNLVAILFRIRSRCGRWKTAHEVLVDRPTRCRWNEWQGRSLKEANNRQATFYDKNLRKLTPAQCFEGAIEDVTNTIFMNLKGELAINELRSIAQNVGL